MHITLFCAFKTMKMKKIVTTFLAACLTPLINAQEIDISSKNISIISGAVATSPNNNTDFGEQISASGSISKTFIISNTGTTNLVLSGNPMVTVNNADFSVTGMPVSPIPPGGSTSFTIKFDPSSNAAINATVSIANNDVNENPYTFAVIGRGLASRTARWVNNTGATRPVSVVMNGDVYATANTTYTNIQLAIAAANDYDIIFVTNGRYVNPAEATSTNCIAGGTGQDPNLNININKANIIITSETGDYATSSAKLVGYSLNLTDTIGNVTIQGLTLDSVRQNAIYNSDYIYLASSLNSPNVRILKNKISNVRGHGLKTDTRSAFVIDRGMWEINGNHFENIGYYNGSGNCTGTVNTSAIWLGEAGSSFEINNNTIKNAAWGGILCIGFGNPTGNVNGGVVISGNKITTTGNAGIQIGWTTTGGFYVPNNALVSHNFIDNANTSHAVGIAGISMVQSNIKNVKILNNHVTNSYNGLAIQVAGWQDNANDTTIVRFNNFCNLVAGSKAITHVAGISPNGLFGTPDDLFKYKFDHNYYGSSTGPTYSSNPGGTGEALAKEVGANASYSANDFNYMPFSTSPNVVSAMQPGTIMGAMSICEGSSTTYSVDPVAGAVSYNWTLPNGWTGTSTTNVITVSANATGGNLQVLTASSCGTTGVSVQALAINPLPNVGATSDKPTLCNGETSIITANNASTYVWSNAVNAASISVSPTVTTTYTVTGTDANNCSKSFTISQIVSECLGLASASAYTSRISVYPNPNNGVFTVVSDSDINLNVVDQLGRVVKTISISKNNSMQLTITELANGVYFIVDAGSARTLNQKVIVAK